MYHNEKALGSIGAVKEEAGKGRGASLIDGQTFFTEIQWPKKVESLRDRGPSKRTDSGQRARGNLPNTKWSDWLTYVHGNLQFLPIATSLKFPLVIKTTLVRLRMLDGGKQ